MRKYILAIIASLSVMTATTAQTITQEDFKKIIPFLQKEDFEGAYKTSTKLLKSTINDSSDLRGIVTYMNILSAAGMVSLDKMTNLEFEQATQGFIGQYVLMPAHPCIDSAANGYNSIQFVRNDSGTLEGLTITANRLQTNILCFEYFDFAEPVNPAELMGKNVRCGGILTAIETNPNPSKIWITRIRVDQAFTRVITPR